MNRRYLLPIIDAAVALTLAVPEQSFAQVNPESDGSRQAKNVRYNGGGCDLTTPGQECFFEQYELAVPLIPIKESTVVFVGEVNDVQSYLSADRTHIYTEITFRVEELLKSPERFILPPTHTLIADQLGGTIKLHSGRILHDGTRAGYIGKPRIGARYVVFLTPIHEDKDFEILVAYELREGKVFRLTEDGSPGHVVLSRAPNKPDSLSNEKTFLQTIRQRKRFD